MYSRCSAWGPRRASAFSAIVFGPLFGLLQGTAREQPHAGAALPLPVGGAARARTAACSPADPVPNREHSEPPRQGDRGRPGSRLGPLKKTTHFGATHCGAPARPGGTLRPSTSSITPERCAIRIPPHRPLPRGIPSTRPSAATTRTYGNRGRRTIATVNRRHHPSPAAYRPTSAPHLYASRFDSRGPDMYGERLVQPQWKMNPFGRRLWPCTLAWAAARVYREARGSSVGWPLVAGGAGVAFVRTNHRLHGIPSRRAIQSPPGVSDAGPDVHVAYGENGPVPRIPSPIGQWNIELQAGQTVRKLMRTTAPPVWRLAGD